MFLGETIHNLLLQDISWWFPDIAVFFGVLYLALFIFGSLIGYLIFEFCQKVEV